jgi:hypothetical protein
MMIYKIEDIFSKLENCIEYNLPFSHIRFGDGGIKYIHSILYRDFNQLDVILKKEGIPKKLIVETMELWGYYARRADFIDTPEVYYTGEFWPRIKKPGKPINQSTDEKLRRWKDLYDRAEIINDSYCNPESNCLMILKREGKKNLFDIMKDRKVCLITARPEVKQILPQLDIIEIVGQWKNQYKNSFKKVKKFIEQNSKKYDFFMVAAGELGRLYSGMIKECGGRSIDVGFIVEYWLDGELHPRFHLFIQQSFNNKLEMVLTNEGKKYDRFI